jgi:zinc protease
LQAPKEDMRTLLQLEALRLETGCKLIPEEQFEREREVVRNEIRQRMGTPDGQMIYETLRAAYPEGHPYHEMVGGNDEQLTNITMDDVCKFMADYYVPARATVIVTGNVDQEEVGKTVNQFFGGIPPGNPAPRTEVTPISIKKHTVTKEFDLERTVVNVLWAMPPHFTPEHDNASFMQFALASQAGGLADQYEVCDVAGVSELGGYLAPVMIVSFEVRKGKSVNECLDFVWKAAAQTHRYFETGNYEQQQMQRALAKQRFVEGMEPISSRAEFVADAVQFDKRVDFDGEDNYFYKHLDGIDKLDAGKFKSFVKKTLAKNKALVFIAKASTSGNKGDKRASLKFSGKSHEAKSDPVIDPATANMPLPVPASDSILPKAERYSLKNGMKVVLLPYNGLPIVHANLIFNAGSIHEPVSKSGLADMAAGLSLPGGASAMRAAGVSVGGRGGMDHTTFTARGINIYLSEVINGLERIVKVGRISQRGIEDYQKRFKDRFSRPSYQRDYAYQLELEAAIYGKDHPYVTKGSATPKTLGKIGQDSSLAFGRKHYSAKNGTLIIAGNFDPAKAKKIIADSFGDWSGGHKDKPVPLATPARSGPEYIGVVGKEGMPQMQVRIAYPAPAGIDSQQAARLVLAQMMTLRMATVRTELGSTYGIYAGRSTRVGPTSYQVGGTVDAARAGESLKFMRAKLQELRDGKDFERDFVTARHKVLKSLLAQSTESYTLAGRLSQIERYGLDPDYNDKLARNVASVLPKQVKALMAVELDPKNEIIVNMADRPTLDKAFAEAGLDNVRIVDPTIK